MGIAANAAAPVQGWRKAMSTKTKIAAVALTALTLTTAVAATTGQAQAGHRHGVGIGLGIAAGALVGAAIASNAYGAPVYGYRECRYVERYDRWGNIRMVRICDVY